MTRMEPGVADGLALWNSPISTCSQKVRLVLAEKGLPWEDRRIRFDANEHLADWYLAINPNGVVPTLVHDRTIVPDSSVIGEYLEDVFPNAGTPLRPRDPAAASAVRAWRQFIDEVPTPAIRPPSFNHAFVRIWAGLDDAAFEAHVSRLPLREHFYRKMGRRGFDDAAITEARERLALTLDRMARTLADGRAYLCGDYSLADAALTPTLVRMEDIRLASLWDRHRDVAAWYDRIRARPAFAVAYYPGTRDISPAC